MTPDERAALDERYRTAETPDEVDALLTDLLDALDAETARADAAEALASRNWKSWEREATEHARTLGLIGAPKTGEPLSEGEQARFSAAIERGLRKRAEDLAEDLEARGLDLAASNAALTAERDDWRRRYEALRDGVTGLHFRDARGGCASCIDPDGFSVWWPCETAAVVARVEGDES